MFGGLANSVRPFYISQVALQQTTSIQAWENTDNDLLMKHFLQTANH